VEEEEEEQQEHEQQEQEEQQEELDQENEELLKMIMVGGGGEKGEGGKPDWKKLRKERKALKESRKKKEMRPEFYLVTKKAKEVWEELRKASTPAEERSRMCEKLTTLIQPYIKKVLYSNTIFLID